MTPKTMPKLYALTLVAGLLALAGCGSSSSSTTSTTAAPASSTPAATTTAPAGTTSAGTTLVLAADPGGQLKYEQNQLTAKAGPVTIDFANMSSTPHNVTIEGSLGKVIGGKLGKIEGATPTFSGGSKSLTLNLKAGRYKFYCSVPGHRQAGMEGTLTVE